MKKHIELKLNYRQNVEKMQINENNYKDICFPDEFLMGIYDVVKFTKELCEREKIEYFIDGGTMLGCVRDGGQILYDNDADFGILPLEFKKLLPFKNEFEKKNYDFIIQENCKIQIQNKNVYMIQNDSINDKNLEIRVYPGLDILVYKIIKDKFISKVVIQDDDFRNQYPHAWHYQKHLYPLKDYTYKCLNAEPLILKGANNPKNYLDGTYPEWKTKKIYDHKIYVIQ
jgi:phosphorylcholine metabolism protein LicD